MISFRRSLARLPRDEGSYRYVGRRRLLLTMDTVRGGNVRLIFNSMHTYMFLCGTPLHINKRTDDKRTDDKRTWEANPMTSAFDACITPFMYAPIQTRLDTQVQRSRGSFWFFVPPLPSVSLTVIAINFARNLPKKNTQADIIIIIIIVVVKTRSLLLP